MFIIRNPSHSTFGLSAAARFFLEEDDGANLSGGASEGATDTLSEFEPGDGLPPSRPTSPAERVEGEKLPDFGSLGKKPAATTEKPAAEKPAKPEEGTNTPPKDEKPAGGQPSASATAAKPASETPKPGETAKPATETTKEATKPGETAKPEETKLPEIPKDDSDLDALKPKPGVPTHVVKSFDDMRARMKAERQTARKAVEQATKLQQEIESLKQNTGQLPEDVQKELEGLRSFNMLFRAEQDPRFRDAFVTPITKAEEGIYSTLQKHGLNPKVIEEIKATAEKNGGDIEAWPRWKELVDAFKNPVDQQELLAALQSRRSAIANKQTRLQELTGSKQKFEEELGKMEETERNKFAQGIEEHSGKFAESWIFEEEVPANATPEQKAAIEARNAVAKQRAEAFGNNARDLYFRDPEKVSEIAFKAVKLDYVTEQLDSVTKERDKAVARAKELEGQLAKIKSAGRMAHVETPVTERPAKTTTTQEGKIGGDGQSAIHNFFAKQAS